MAGRAAHWQFNDGTALPASVQLFARKDAQADAFRSVSVNNGTDASVVIQIGSRTYTVPAFQNVTQPHPPIPSISFSVLAGVNGSPLRGSIYISANDEALAATSSLITGGSGGGVGP